MIIKAKLPIFRNETPYREWIVDQCLKSECVIPQKDLDRLFPGSPESRAASMFRFCSKHSLTFTVDKKKKHVTFRFEPEE